MKQLLVYLLILGAGGYAYRLYTRPHLAPDGTYFLLEYASARTATGVVGFAPGQEVRLIETRPNGNMRVTDGFDVVDLPPNRLTDNLDIAAALRLQDGDGQESLAASSLSQEQAQKRAGEAADIAHARDMDRFNANASAGSLIGLYHTRLNEKSSGPVSYAGAFYYGVPYYVSSRSSGGTTSGGLAGSAPRGPASNPGPSTSSVRPTVPSNPTTRTTDSLSTLAGN